MTSNYQRALNLPKPDDKFTNGDATWEILGKAVVDSWTDEGGPVVKLSVAGRYFTPTEARKLAYALLSAANHAEAQARGMTEGTL